MAHPRGLFLVGFVELWERFSFYTLMGLLVLFLTAPIASGGFGWSSRAAVLLYAVYAGLGFIAPAAGGWVASRWLGERKAILSGGILIAIGQFLLVVSSSLPSAIEQLHGMPVHGVLSTLDLPIGALYLTPAVSAAIEALVIPSHRTLIGGVYLIMGWGLAGSLAFVIVGTGLLKPCISSIVGKLYEPHDKRRELGFAIFLVFIYLGPISASLVAGTLGERIGWTWGFAAGGTGMAIGLALYIARARAVLGDVGITPDRYAVPVGSESAVGTRERIQVLLVMGFFAVVYASAFYQKAGMLNLFARDYVDREVGSFLIPTTWFQAISTATFILLAHRITAGFTRGRLASIDPAQKLAGALMLISIGYVFFSIGAAQAHAAATARTDMWPVICGYVFFGLGDIFIWPVSIALASRLAPPRHVATVVGCWYLTQGVAVWLTGPIAWQAARIGHTNLFVEISAYCAFAAVLVLWLRPWIVRRINSV